ncbi:helix-turn-helix domain-containing protein [Dysosmobacter sp.]|uniref:helix-turn-helix domain-containing protein n=1 Tax=Dysosmobacter sp. TaxID=2591382 RepID=UPI002DBD42EB|nr:helix-turn-helix transcriptional regulator [Dysosmobacter sp.]
MIKQGDEMIYQRIRDLREDNDWKQEYVAEKIGITQTTYSKYELGKVNIPLDMMIRLADLYHVSVDYLVGRTDEP